MGRGTPEERLDWIIERAASHKPLADEIGDEEASILRDLKAAEILKSLLMSDPGNENCYPFIILREPLKEGDPEYGFIKDWLNAGEEKGEVQ